MKKLFLPLAIVLFLALTACGGSAEDIVESAQSVAEDVVESVNDEITEATEDEAVADETTEDEAMEEESSNFEEGVNFWPQAGEGIVISVAGTEDGLAPDFGDRIETGIFAPIEDDTEVDVIAGEEYEILMITPDESTQVLMIYNLNEPMLKEQMSYIVTKVGSLGGDPNLKRGDTFTIQIQLGNSLDATAPEDSLDVTFSFTGSVVSFIVPSDASAPTAEDHPSVTGETVSPPVNQSPRPVVVTGSADGEASLDLNGLFQLQTLFLEDQNKCLNGNNISEEGATLDGVAFMDDCSNDEGQIWSFTLLDDGYYHLQTVESAANNLCLESNGFGGEFGGGSFMNNCSQVTGEKWKFYATQLDGYYRMIPALHENDNHCLEGNRLASESVLQGASFMDTCQNVSGQYWKLVAAEAPVSAGALQGQVVDATTGTPLAEGLVCIQGTDLCAAVDGNGSYTLADLPDGDWTLTATASGYFSAEQSVTVVAGETGTQNVALSPEIVEGDIRIILTWGETPTDLDSYLGVPSEDELSYINYQDKGAADSFPFAYLDLDDESQFGPETITISERVSGTYSYIVDIYQSSGSFDGVLVQVYGPTGLIAEFNGPTDGEGSTWWVFDLDGDTDAITEVNKLDEVPGQ
ncbi:MAG: hypothetical protein GY943_04740 [Chloroflexi bacterium]|nr:hypothetical protein [Chloroflexota bacterium]